VEVSRLPPGPYRLAIFSADGEGLNASRRLLGEERLQMAPGERREISVDIDDLSKRFASISGKVVGGVDLGSVRLNILSEEDPEEIFAFGPTLPDAGGRFRFTGLPAGRCAIVARVVAVEPAALARFPVEVGEREAREIEVALE